MKTNKQTLGYALNFTPKPGEISHEDAIELIGDPIYHDYLESPAICSLYELNSITLEHQNNSELLRVTIELTAIGEPLTQEELETIDEPILWRLDDQFITTKLENNKLFIIHK